MNFLFTVFGSAWIGSAVAMANDLVLPRMRGTASAFYILMMTFVGLALGPFLMGWLSTTLEAGGVDSGRSLQLAMLASLGAYVLGVIFFWLAGRSVASDESTRIERAQAVGEVVEAA
jgi:MFS family permease